MDQETVLDAAKRMVSAEKPEEVIYSSAAYRRVIKALLACLHATTSAERIEAMKRLHERW